jgi:hypothetical protein
MREFTTGRALFLLSPLLLAMVGCQLQWGGVDPGAVSQARLALRSQEDKFPFFDEPELPAEEQEETGSVGEVILGELLAIFPGVLIHGMGHFYAGDTKTGGQLLRVGGTGYLLAGIGGGLFTGGYFLDHDTDQRGLAYSLYGTGGFIGGVGVLFILAAWGYDLIDTPRAVLSGGRPPPRSDFVDSLDVFVE